MVFDNATVAQAKYHTHTMSDTLPPLGGLSLNDDAPPAAADLPELPPELYDMILTRYLNKFEVEELSEANLLLVCMALRGTDQCNDPDDPLWQAACARFGLTERVVGGVPGAPATPTWHATFLAMCNDVGALNAQGLALYKGLLNGMNPRPPPDFRIIPMLQRLWVRAALDYRCMAHYLLGRVDGIIDEGDLAMAGLGTALYHASAAGDLAAVEFLLANGADALSGDELTVASENGHLAIVDILIAQGASVYARSPFMGETAVIVASENGHLAVLERLVAAGAVLGDDAVRALRNASENGHLAVVQFLIDHGVMDDLEDGPALHEAAEHGHLAIVEVLLAHGAYYDNARNLALEKAIETSRLAIIELLLAQGVRVNDVPGRALLNACDNGNLAVVQRVLAAADMSDPVYRRDIESVLFMSQYSRHDAILEALRAALGDAE